MRTRKPVFLCLALTLIAAQMANAQVVRRMVGPAPETSTIAELQAQVGLAEDGRHLEVVNAMSASNRSEGYKKVNLKTGDRVLAINGKPARSVADFQTSYDATPTGKMLEIGVQRGDQRWIERFAKADPASLPQVRRIEIQGNPEDMVMLMGIGVILSLQDEELRVNALFPGGAGAELFKEGDVFVSINGDENLEPAELQARWDSLATGDEVAFTLRRDGENVSFSVAKAASHGVQRRVVSQ